MKRTTYILLGVLLALLAGMSGTIILMSMLSTPYKHSKIFLKGEERMKPLPSCKVVRLVEDWTVYKYNENISYRILPDAHNLVVASADSAVGSFVYPSGLEEFLRFEQKGDTLDIVYGFPPEKLKKLADDHELDYSTSLVISPVRLCLPDGVKLLRVNLQTSYTRVQGMRRDSFALDLLRNSHLEFDGAHFRALSVKSREMTFVSGSVESLYLNLDDIRKMTVVPDSFRIDTEYLSGTSNVNFHANPQECRRIVWIPLTKKAMLNLKMKDRTEILLHEYSSLISY